MPQYDGSIRINTEINTKGGKESLSSLKHAIEGTAKEIKNLQSKMNALKDQKIPTQEYQNLQKELEIATKEMDKMLSQDKKLADIDAKIKSLSHSSAEYAAKIKEAAEQKIPTKEYSDIQKQIELTEKKLFSLYDRQERFLSTGEKESSSAYKRMVYDAEQLDIKLRQAEADMKSLVDSGKAFTLGTDTEQYKNLFTKYEQVNQELEKQKNIHSEIAQKQADAVQKTIELKSQISQLVKEGKDFTLGKDTDEYANLSRQLQYEENALKNLVSQYKKLELEQGTVSERFSRMKDSAKKAFNAVASGTKKSGGLFSAFASRFKGLALSLLIFNQISKAFNNMISGMKQGFTNFMNYSDSFSNSVQGMKNSMSTLGNQMAATFAPIVQMIIPWLTKLVSAISTAMTYVAQFIAILGGKSTFTRAKQVQDSYNKALGGTAAAAKRAYGALAKFDDLDVLQKKEDDATGGAGDAIGGLFEEAPVDRSMLDAVKKLKNILMQLFEPLKKAWEQEGKFVMKAWKYALDEIGKLIKDIGRDFLTMWNQDATVRMFADILHIVGDIGLVIGNIANALDEAWNENQTGLRILENIRDIFAVIIKNIREAADFTVEWSKTLDFSPLLESVEHLTRALVPFADFVSGTLADFYTEFLLPLASWALSEDGIPRLINILGDFMDAVDWEALRTSLKNLYSALEPYAENVAEGLIDFLEEVKNFGVDFLNSLPGPIQKLADALKSGDPEKVRSWATTLLEFIVSVKALKTAFEGFEIVKSGLALFGTGGMASTIASTAPEAAEGISLLATAFGYLTATLSSLAAASVLIDPFLNDLGIAAGANGQQVDTLADRYDGLGGKINVVKDFLSLGSNAMEGFGLNASNTAGQIGALETVMNNIADGMIYTDSQLEKLRTRFGLTDEDIEMLRQSMLDTNEPLRQLADDFGLFDASVETLQGIQTGMELLEDGTLSASEAFDEFSKPMWGMNDAALNFFQSISDGSISLDGYQSKLNETSQTVNEFSENMKEVGGNIAGGITQGFENADVETPVRGFFRSVLDSLSSVFDMHSPAKNMEPSGENIMLGVLEGFKNCFGMVKEVVSEFFQNMELSFSENLQNLQVFFTEAWSNLYESTVETWTLIQEYFTEFWKLFIESLTETWEEILLLFTENWEEIRILFEDFLLFLNEVFLVSWLETWTMAGQEYQTFNDLLTVLTKAIQNMLTLFMKQIEVLIKSTWKNSWKNAENLFEEFKNNVEELSNNIREIIQSLFDFVMSLIAQMLAGLESVAAKAASLSGGGFSLGGGGAAPAAASYSAQNFSAFMDNVPHLASGSVIRGGNPFMAILGDQRIGQTNVEAPAGLIKDMVKEGIREEMGNFQINGGQVKIAVQVNGADLAQVTLDDFLSEMGRQGYNVDLLGYT